MGLVISSVGKGSPGEKGVPGDTFNNKQLLQHLKKGLNSWQRAYLWLNPSELKKAERAIAVLEKKTGIMQRQMLIDGTVYPNELLATAASLEAIENQQKTEPGFKLSDIDGFLMVSDTRDTVFPVSGKAVVAALGIKPKHFANTALACSSIVNALQQACAWMAHDNNCNTVLITACDITSRLHQEKTAKQPFLFGDQGVAFILKKTKGLGGFKLSNIYLDPHAPDIVHLPLYTGDAKERGEVFKASDFGNDTNLKLFGDYEAKAIAALYRLYIETTGFKPPDGRQMISDHEMFVVPQVTKNILSNAATNAELNCDNFGGYVSRNTVFDHGITGAASTPLALYYLAQERSLSNTGFTAFISAIGGLNAIFTFDPQATEPLSYEYTVDFSELSFSAQDDLTMGVPELAVRTAKPSYGLNKRPAAHFSVRDIANSIMLTLGSPLKTTATS